MNIKSQTLHYGTKPSFNANPSYLDSNLNSSLKNRKTLKNFHSKKPKMSKKQVQRFNQSVDNDLVLLQELENLETNSILNYQSEFDNEQDILGTVQIHNEGTMSIQGTISNRGKKRMNNNVSTTMRKTLFTNRNNAKSKLVASTKKQSQLNLASKALNINGRNT